LLWLFGGAIFSFLSQVRAAQQNTKIALLETKRAIPTRREREREREKKRKREKEEEKR
jgi:hypothetical protein